MTRLYRPYIPLSVRVAVAERQLRERVPAGKFRYMFPGKSTYGNKLLALLPLLAKAFRCKLKDLRLDHDPPLGARPRIRRGLGRKTYYIPDANDPEHLNYRPHGPQFDGSHLIKTNVRGEHGQHPDRVLIKKARRLENPGRAKKKARISTLRKTAKPAPKRPWPKRKFEQRRKP